MCPGKGAAVWTFIVTSDYDVIAANQPFQILLMSYCVMTENFVTDVVSLEYYRAVASAVGATGKPQPVLCS